MRVVCPGNRFVHTSRPARTRTVSTASTLLSLLLQHFHTNTKTRALTHTLALSMSTEMLLGNSSFPARGNRRFFARKRVCRSETLLTTYVLHQRCAFVSIFLAISHRFRRFFTNLRHLDIRSVTAPIMKKITIWYLLLSECLEDM